MYMYVCIYIYIYIYTHIFTFMNRYETSHVHRLLIKGTIKCLEVISISILTSRLRIICTIFDATPLFVHIMKLQYRKIN